MGTQMLQRRGTSAEWAAANVVLGDGEIGFDRTTGEFRIGDGVTAWNSLANTDIFIPRSTLDTLYFPRATVDAAGDLLVGSTDNTVVRLGKGTDGQRLTIVAGSVAWADLPAEDNPLVVIDAAGDMIYGTGPDAAAKLPIGTAGQVLSVVAGAPAWVTPATSNDLEVLYWTGP